MFGKKGGGKRKEKGEEKGGRASRAKGASRRWQLPRHMPGHMNFAGHGGVHGAL